MVDFFRPPASGFVEKIKLRHHALRGFAIRAVVALLDQILRLEQLQAVSEILRPETVLDGVLDFLQPVPSVQQGHHQLLKFAEGMAL